MYADEVFGFALSLRSKMMPCFYQDRIEENCKDFDPNKTVRDAPLIFIFIILVDSLK